VTDEGNIADYDIGLASGKNSPARKKYCQSLTSIVISRTPALSAHELTEILLTRCRRKCGPAHNTLVPDVHLCKQVACRAIGIYEWPLERRAGRNSGAGLRKSNLCGRGGNEALRASEFGCVIVLEAGVRVPGSKI